VSLLASSLAERVLAAPLHSGSGVVPKGTRTEVFGEIYTVFLVLGTIVGVVVVGYMLYNAYKYRDDGGEELKDAPTLGELPEGGGKGKKLFLSFGLSAIIVISLIVWTYGALLYVEEGAVATAQEQQQAALEVEVVGFQFGWRFVYPNGHETTGTLRIPADRLVQLQATSDDVHHNFGVPELRAKADGIPGQYTSTWILTEEPGEYAAHCYELCGSGHSYMDATVIVMEPEAYQEWYEGTEPAEAATNESAGGEASTGGSSDGGHHG
jgi:cytochrome c oxidase subunit 2